MTAAFSTKAEIRKKQIVATEFVASSRIDDWFPPGEEELWTFVNRIAECLEQSTSESLCRVTVP